MVVDTATNRIYVSLREDGVVAVVDGATNTVRGTINLGSGSDPKGLALDQARHLLYVTRSNPDGLTVVDTSAGTVGSITTTITAGMGADPYEVAYNPNTRRLYVINNNFRAVTVIDGATNGVVGTSLDLGSDIYTLFVDPATRRLYLTTPSNIIVLDVSNDVLDDTDIVAVIADAIVPPGVRSRPGSPVKNAVTARFYVQNVDATSISMIDEAAIDTFGQPISVGPRPTYSDYNSSRNRLYAIVEGANKVVAVGPSYSVKQNGADVRGVLPGTTVQVSWASLFGMHGNDRLGLFPTGAPSNSTPAAVTFTNGSGAGGGTGAPQGTVNLTIPGNVTPGSYEVRFISGYTNKALASLALKVGVPPTAVADTYTTSNGVPLNVTAADGLLKNDTDADTPTGSLTVSVVSTPANGTVNLQPNGAFTYSAGANFSGTDTFTYKVTDADGFVSTTVPVTITVNAVACGPRPGVQVTTTVSGGALQATVSVGNEASGQVQNRIQTIQFNQVANATVTVNGTPFTENQTFTPTGPITSQVFTVRRVTPGQASTVRFTVTDGCGSWPTFVGGGTSAGF
jgi:DNA-binding beta-propeller fold protein YncE